MSSFSNFIQSVCPPTGYVCVSANAKIDKFFDMSAPMDMAELDAWVLDRVPTHDLFFTPATFSDQVSRSNQYLLARRAIVLDIDIKAGAATHYPTKEDAATGFKEMLARSMASSDSMAIPVPDYIVCSGYGWHVYWLLPEALPFDEWSRLNAAYLSLLAKHGDPRLFADMGTSKRAAGLFRIPLTRNLKDYANPQQITIRHTAAAGADSSLATVWDQFLEYAADVPAVSAPTNGAIAVPAGATFLQNAPVYAQVAADSAPILAALSSNEPLDYRTLESSCAVFRHAVEAPGELGYSGWLAVARVFQQLPDGREAFHALSSLDAARYDEAATDTKFTDAARMHEGVRCDTFHAEVMGSLDAARPKCVGCRHFRPTGGGSPLEAGRISRNYVPTQNVSLPTDDADDAFEWTTEHEIKIDLPAHLLGGPGATFHVDAYKHLVFVQKKKIPDPEDPTQEVWESKPPVTVSELPFWLGKEWVVTTDSSEQSVQHRIVHFVDAQGHARRIRMTPEEISSAAKFITAAHRGRLIVRGHTPAQVAVIGRYLQYLVETNARDATMMGEATTAFGWGSSVQTADPSFVIGGFSYHGGGRRRRVELGEGAEIAQSRAMFGFGGSFSAQKTALQIFSRDGVSAGARAALLMGLASPFVKFTGEGGCAVMLLGPTGTGKTGTLRSISALWGSGEGKSLTPTDTEHGRSAVLGALSNLPAICDEFTLMSGGQFGRMMLNYSAGTGRNRATAEGRLSSVTADYHNLVLGGSNKDVDYLVADTAGISTEQAAAIRKRVIVVDFTAPAFPRTTDWLRSVNQYDTSLRSDFGWVAPRVMDHFLSHFAALTAYLSQRREFWQSKFSDQGDRFEAALYACTDLVERILSETRLLDARGWTETFVRGRFSDLEFDTGRLGHASTQLVTSAVDWVRSLYDARRDAFPAVGGNTASQYTSSSRTDGVRFSQGGKTYLAVFDGAVRAACGFRETDFKQKLADLNADNTLVRFKQSVGIWTTLPAGLFDDVVALRNTGSRKAIIVELIGSDS